MMKIIAFAALVAVASAASHAKPAADPAMYKLSEESNATVAAAQAAQVKADTIGATANYLGKGLKANQDSVTDRYQGSADKVAAIGKEVAATHSRVDALLKATVSAIKTKMSARKQLLMTKLAERAKKTTVAAQLKTANQGVASDIATVNKALAKIKSDNAASAKIETTMASCTNQKKVFDSKAGKCVDAVASADSNMAKVHHHGFENDDGRDCGYLNYRTLEFEKFEEDTYVRVFYYDNMRVHGHHSTARWNVMFCSPGGSNCAKCKDPGQVQNWRYSHHQHNWWMNDHTPGTAFGLCRASESQKIGKGKWSIRIMLDDCRYDIYTGSGDYGSIMVDEVMRY
jgi:hypothetical protein